MTRSEENILLTEQPVERDLADVIEEHEDYESLNKRYRDRELSWLEFNDRVLQEAADRNVPLFERVRFLAIYSSNLDEFFRVRVASLRSLLRLGKKTRKKLTLDPSDLLKAIHDKVHEQQERIGNIYRNELLPSLAKQGIRIIDERSLSQQQETFITEWFEEHLRDSLNAAFVRANSYGPFLENQRLYLVVQLRARLSRQPLSKLKQKEDTDHPLAFVEIPSEEFGRFVSLPTNDGTCHVIYLDDLLRFNLPRIFPGFDAIDSWSVKISRDAELYIDDEFSGDLLRKIKKSLHKRETGVPSRFLYDQTMPADLLKTIRKGLDFSREDLVAGGRYHNLRDLFGFPFPETDDDSLVYEKREPLPACEFEKGSSMLDVIQEKDRLLCFPYQSYDYVVRFVEEGANDPDVTEIQISLYRVAEDSAIVKGLIRAAEQGKQVVAFVELKARFDEEMNILWAGKMEQAGVRVIYSFPGLKVHAKLCLITRTSDSGRTNFAYIATGNFNEKTARVYSDSALMTADPRLTSEVYDVFEFLKGNTQEPQFRYLLVAPFTLRTKLSEMVDREIQHAKEGKPSGIVLKLNSLEDREMIDKLYEASEAGVPVQLIIRGIDCLRSGVKGMSQSITSISIVDRYLEHARIYRFVNDDDPQLYLASADWMKRNLSRRVEVATPIFDPDITRFVNRMLESQWNDHLKARSLDEGKVNHYIDNRILREWHGSQHDMYYELRESNRECLQQSEMEGGSTSLDS